jgi:hypothetical protein
LIDDLECWLRGILEKLSRKSDTSAAIIYALNLWPALTRCCDDGQIEIDNSAIACKSRFRALLMLRVADKKAVL